MLSHGLMCLACPPFQKKYPTLRHRSCFGHTKQQLGWVYSLYTCVYTVNCTTKLVFTFVHFVQYPLSALSPQLLGFSLIDIGRLWEQPPTSTDEDYKQSVLLILGTPNEKLEDKLCMKRIKLHTAIFVHLPPILQPHFDTLRRFFNSNMFNFKTSFKFSHTRTGLMKLCHNTCFTMT